MGEWVKRGNLFVFEGGEAGGKTTQISLVKTYLESLGFRVESGREPGGVPSAERIRSCLLKPEEDPNFSYAREIEKVYSELRSEVSAVTQAFLLGSLANQHLFEKEDPKHGKDLCRLSELGLYMGARRPFHEAVVAPALEDPNCIFLSDRCGLSSRGYQGFGYDPTDHRFDEVIKRMNLLATGGIEYNLAFILDQEPKIGLAKTTTEEFGSKDRIERKPLEYHVNVRNGYLHMAKEDPERVKIVPYIKDDPRGMHKEIVKYIDQFIKDKELKCQKSQQAA
ncbi:dTMP kinase [Nanoarchaeota archaeon]